MANEKLEFDASALFPGYESARARLLDDNERLQVRLRAQYETVRFEMQIDRIHQFLHNARLVQVEGRKRR